MLGFVAAADFAELVADQVCTPLGVRDLTLELGAEQRERIAPGHDVDGHPTFTPTYPAGAPSGGYYGTAADLLTFLGAHLSGPFESTLELAIRSHFVAADVDLGLGWHIDEFSSTRRVWKNGGLPGYRSHVAMADGIGVVVLSNTARSVDDLAGEVLRDLLL
jgi:CubicO group peptidase (beta-lactamase class C family)